MCLRNTKEHPIPFAELNMIVKKYDRFIDVTRRKNDDFVIEGLENFDESEKHEMPDRDVNC